MSLKDKIGEEIKAAMKAKDKVRLATVRSVKKAILEKEVSLRSGEGAELTEAHEIELLSQLAKQRRDSIAQYEAAGRPDLAQSEAQELAILEEFLPQPLSEADIEAAIDAQIAKVGASSPKDMGKVMGPLMQQMKGRADGKFVQERVKAKLGG